MWRGMVRRKRRVLTHLGRTRRSALLLSPVSCFYSMSQDDEEVVEGLAGAPYRGFGRCFKCSESFSYCSVYKTSFLSDDPALFR